MSDEEAERFSKLVQEWSARHSSQLERRRLLYHAKKLGTVLPAIRRGLEVYEQTLAHRILHILETRGPQTSRDLGASTRFAGMAVSAAIVRLLDLDYIERDSFGTYKITDKGSDVLSRLPLLVERTSVTDRD